MGIGLIITLVGILLLMVLGYNIMLQYKVKVRAAKKQETARYLAIIDATEQLISNAHHIPYSKELLVCLNTRILDALENMQDLDPQNKHLKQRAADVKVQITNLKELSTNNDSTGFKIPRNDKQAISMLKLVKRLRETIRSEHNKGRFETQAYVAENARLESIQLRINIENLIKRTNDAVIRGQVGTAVQLLKKGIDVLSSKNDQYSIQAREKLQAIYDDMENNRKNLRDSHTQQVEQESKERNQDLDAIFGDKKKW
jgi:hypothetical protein